MQPPKISRAARVAGRVREEIARALSRDLSDPRLELAVVTGVEMPDDLSFARVKVRNAAGGGAAKERARLLAGLAGATGILRRRVAGALGLRRAPELRFVYDEGEDASRRIEEVLLEIERDRRDPSE